MDNVRWKEIPEKWHQAVKDELEKIDQRFSIFDSIVTIDYDDGSKVCYKYSHIIVRDTDHPKSKEALLLTEHCGYITLRLSVYDKIKIKNQWNRSPEALAQIAAINAKIIGERNVILEKTT